MDSFANGEDRSIVIIHNCRIHNSDAFIVLVRKKGGIVVYLPLYSPDLNPIEKAFNFLKQWIRRSRGIAESNTKQCIFRAFSDITPDDATGFFRDCGYFPK